VTRRWDVPPDFQVIHSNYFRAFVFLVDISLYSPTYRFKLESIVGG